MRLFANVGFSPEMIIPSIRRRPDLEEVVLFSGDDPRSKKARDEIATAARGNHSKIRNVPLQDVFEPVDVFRTYLTEFRRTGGRRDIVFNCAGGTGLVVATATAFCIALGIPSVYVVRETGREVEFPSATFGFRYGWLPSHRAVLRSMSDGDLQVSSLSASIGLTPGRVSTLVKELEASGLISSKRSGREKLLSLNPFAQMILEADEFMDDDRGRSSKAGDEPVPALLERRGVYV